MNLNVSPYFFPYSVCIHVWLINRKLIKSLLFNVKPYIFLTRQYSNLNWISFQIRWRRNWNVFGRKNICLTWSERARRKCFYWQFRQVFKGLAAVKCFQITFETFLNLFSLVYACSCHSFSLIEGNGWCCVFISRHSCSRPIYHKN